MNAAHGMPATTPAVLMADLNSYAKRQPNGAQKILTNLGWQDSWNAPSRTNIQYSSINYNPQLADGSGFPAKPYVFKKSKRNPLGQATRIDYIMTLGPGVKAVDYKLVIYTNGDGTFNVRRQDKRARSLGALRIGGHEGRHHGAVKAELGPHAREDAEGDALRQGDVVAAGAGRNGSHLLVGHLLAELLKNTEIRSALVFTRTKHGANRLASNSLLECFVFGEAAAKHIAPSWDALPPVPAIRGWDESRVTDSDEEVVIKQNWTEIRRFMWNYVGIVRTTKRLERAAHRIKMLTEETDEYYAHFRVTPDLIELRNLLQCAELIVRSALHRHGRARAAHRAGAHSRRASEPCR
mgnify:CR=1 FL=1